MNLAKKINNASTETTPVMRKRPPKLLKARLEDAKLLLWFGQLVGSPNHAFSISVILSPSVMFRIALEMSDTSGDPLGKTYRTQRYRCMLNSSATKEKGGIETYEAETVGLVGRTDHGEVIAILR